MRYTLKDKLEFINDIRNIYKAIGKIEKTDIKLKYDETTRNFINFIQKYRDNIGVKIRMYEIINQTERLYKYILDNPDAYDEFMGYIKTIIENFDVIKEAFMTRIHYLDDGAPITIKEIYNTSAVEFAGNLKGGTNKDEIDYKYKYLKYRHKCNQLIGGRKSKKNMDEYYKHKYLKYKQKSEKKKKKIKKKK